jgi:hypothetical protein
MGVKHVGINIYYNILILLHKYVNVGKWVLRVRYKQMEHLVPRVTSCLNIL